MSKSKLTSKAMLGKKNHVVGAVIVDGASDRSGGNQVGSFKQEWTFWSILAFGLVTLGTWEGIGTVLQLSFVNGGPAAVVYGCIVTSMGVWATYASLAEMASMYPMVGGPYIWCAQFAPSNWRTFLCYMEGCLSVTAWQIVIAASAYVAAVQTETAIFVFSPTFEIQNWHTSLIMIGMLTISCAFNTLGRASVVKLITALGFYHVCLCFAFILCLLIPGTRASSELVWDNARSVGGWENRGVAFCVGLLGISFCLAGSDGLAHIAEETANARMNIPRGMVYSVAVNAIAAFAFIIVSLYSITNTEDFMAAPFALPELFGQAGLPQSAAGVMSFLILPVCVGGLLAILASAGRITWVAARDGIFWRSEYFSTIDHNLKAPIRAIIANYMIGVLLSLIFMASPTVFSALVSCSTITLYATYLLPIALFLRYRLIHDKVAYGPWRLGRLGVPLNIISLCFGAFLLVFLPFPQQKDVTFESMNYAAPILLLLCTCYITYWLAHQRKHFKGPFVQLAFEMDGDDTGGTSNIFSRESWVTDD